MTEPVLNRRRFLGALGLAGAVGAAGTGGYLLGQGGDRTPGIANAMTEGSGGPPPEEAVLRRAAIDLDPGRRVPVTDAAEPVGRPLPGAVEDRILVVVDLLGGNDGLSTLVPIDDGRYHDLRPELALAPEDVLALDTEVGLHPSLVRLHRRRITTVEGVGPRDGDLSHFAMTQRWQRGDVDGTARFHTGFLGRLSDALDDGSPLVGLSLAGPTPHLLTTSAATMALDGPDDLWFLEPTDSFPNRAYRQGIEATAADPSLGPAGRIIGRSHRELLDLADRLAARRNDDVDGRAEPDWDDPMLAEGGQLGWRLHLGADLIGADVGVRVLYVSDGDYDTHDNHRWRQADNLARLDAAVDGFLRRAEEQGFADRVLVATMSEFGRRVPENGRGLDHGSASTMMVAGPVGDRRLGQRPPLDDLDPDDNLRVTIGFDRYLASLAQDWLGVEAASVLPGAPKPLGLVET